MPYFENCIIQKRLKILLHWSTYLAKELFSLLPRLFAGLFLHENSG